MWTGGDRRAAPTGSRSRATTSGTRGRRSSRRASGRGRPQRRPYQNYDGAYGLVGKASERAYLDRTTLLVAAVPASQRPRPPCRNLGASTFAAAASRHERAASTSAGVDPAQLTGGRDRPRSPARRRGRARRRPRPSRSESSEPSESTFRRPASRRAIPSSSRSSSSGSIRTFESEPMQISIPRSSRRSTGAKPSPRFASVVGQRQTRAPAAATRSSSVVVRVRGVDDGRARPEAPGLGQQLDRPDAVLGEALLDLARLLAGVHVERQALAPPRSGRSRPASPAGRRGRSGGRGRRGSPLERAPRPARDTRRRTPGGSVRARRGRRRRGEAPARSRPRAAASAAASASSKPR